MSQRVKTMMRNYKNMVRERDLLAQEIRSFTGITEAEMIEAMCFHQPKGDRVQETESHDRMERIALEFRQQLERSNRAWLIHLQSRHQELSEEISFFENAIHSLPEDCAGLMWDFLMAELTWDELEDKYHMGRSSLGIRRKKAIEILDRLYFSRDKLYAEYVVR